MKKIKSLLLIAACSLALVACNSVDRKINQLEKACKNNDEVKFIQLADELDKMEKDLTPEQKARCEKIALEFMKKH